MKKKVFSVIIAVAIMISVLPVTSFAANGRTVDNGEPVVLTRGSTTLYFDSLATALNSTWGTEIITVRGTITETGFLDAFYASKLIVAEGATLNCGQLNVSTSYSSGVIVENHGTIKATSVAAAVGNGTLYYLPVSERDDRRYQWHRLGE